MEIKFIPKNSSPYQRMDAHRLRRPPSYSDSLFFLPSEPLMPLQIQDTPPPVQPLLSPITNEFGSRPNPFSPAETWHNRFMSFLFHISLISLFETVFFFQFIAVSEDNGLTKTIDGYINGVLNTCNSWSQNETQAINDILSVFINVTEVDQDYQITVQQRHQFNSALQVQSWMYFAGLISTVVVLGGIGKCARLRLAWKRILIDNLIMVSLLGLYEFLFFKTIVLNYENMSLAELNHFIVSQLQQTCDLLEPGNHT